MSQHPQPRRSSPSDTRCLAHAASVARRRSSSSRSQQAASLPRSSPPLPLQRPLLIDEQLEQEVRDFFAIHRRTSSAGILLWLWPRYLTILGKLKIDEHILQPEDEARLQQIHQRNNPMFWK